MLLHLGGDVTVLIKNIIAIFDMDAAMLSKINKEFLSVAEEEGFVRKIWEDECKTFVLAEIDKKTVVFLSPISSATLLKRSGLTGSIY